ncbi:MAG: AtpZ/AtpI family protein [Bacteroidetes bacterium]|nr:AtpZ/AtpI family protein [Bacteroidota bacterium]
MEQKPPKKKQPLSDYGKYAGLTMQMAATIALGIWAGIKLDGYFGFKKFPIFTVTLSLLSVFVAMYFVIRNVMKK